MYKSDNAIARIFQNQSPRKPKILASNFSPDMRGRHAPKHKLSNRVKEIVVEHINSYHPSVSHYRCAHAPLRKYLPSDLSIKKMFGDLKEKNPDIKLHYETYIIYQIWRRGMRCM